MEKVDIRAAIASLDNFWCPKIIGKANSNLFKIAKGIGSTNWHRHDDEDKVNNLGTGAAFWLEKLRILGISWYP